MSSESVLLPLVILFSCANFFCDYHRWLIFKKVFICLYFILCIINYLSWFWLLPSRWSLQVSPAGQMSRIEAVSPVEFGSLGTGWKWPLMTACLALVVNSAFPSARQRICFGFRYWKKLMQSMWILLLREVQYMNIFYLLILPDGFGHRSVY